MKNIFYIMIIATCFLSSSVSCTTSKKAGTAIKGKYVPDDNKCLVFIGQDLGATGGMEGYNDGYCDSFDTPAGITAYFGISGEGDAPVSGLYETVNWGSGDCCANKYITASRFENCMIAVGFPIVGQEQLFVQGKLDKGLDKVGNWLKSVAPRPVFLRIGYEFDGFDWNHYVAETYVPAFRYIKDYLDAMGIDNVAYVWQSKGHGISLEDHEKWYPGDNYVDWCGFSRFDIFDGNMIRFARAKGKPVFVSESTPTLKENGKYIDSDIKKPEIAEKMWKEWFTPFFRMIEENSDVIKAFSYINVNWYAQPMWKNDKIFQQCDSRIQKSEFITGKWKAKMSENRFGNLPVTEGKFKPTDESLKQYKCPEWFRDAKFGIWSCWGPQTVPGWSSWGAKNMYIGASYDCEKKQYIAAHPDYTYLLEHYGHPSEFGYKDLIPLWKAERWNPEEQMKLFKRAGAKYFATIAVFHDNFSLWDTKLNRWNSVNMGPKKDVVGIWQQAAQKEGLYFGVTEHLAASYNWFQTAHGADRLGDKAGVPYDGANPEYQDLYHEKAAPDDWDWLTNNPKNQRNWFDRIQELVDMYHPDLLYSDSELPFGQVGKSLVAHYYNAALKYNKKGVVYNSKLRDSEGRWVKDHSRQVKPLKISRTVGKRPC